MKAKGRKKVTRHRGTHTHGRGAKKKARGKGHRGGVGKAGTGKRGDQKKTLITKLYGNKYFGKDKVRRAAPKKEIKVMTLQTINDNTKGNELDLKEYRIIGNKLDREVKIVALSASKGAQEAVKRAGGEIVLNVKVKWKKPEEKQVKQNIEIK